MTSPAQQVIDAVWRIESARLIAGLARVVGDVGLAEDLAQDALVAALEQWPESGVPQVPGAWLMAVARRRGVDTIRRALTLRNNVELLGRELSDNHSPMEEIEIDPHVEDDVLRLMFTACHPVLSVEARVALTLKMVAGLSTEQIARAFLVQTSTMAARITRAKKVLTEAGVAFEVPVGEELADRLSSVLEASLLGESSDEHPIASEVPATTSAAMPIDRRKPVRRRVDPVVRCSIMGLGLEPRPGRHQPTGGVVLHGTPSVASPR